LEQIIARPRELPVTRPAEARDGALYWDPLHLQVITTAGATADLDVTGATWALTVSDARDGNALLSKAATATFGLSGVYVESATGGIAHVVIDDGDMTTIGAGSRWYELRMEAPSAHAYLPPGDFCLLEGPLVIRADATT